MGSNNTIGYLFQHLAGVLSKQSDQALQVRLGIGFSQFRILTVLAHSPYIRQRQIAEWLGQTEASISRQIKIMMQKGLLSSTINPHNRREHITAISPKGLSMAQNATYVLNTCHAAVFNDIGEAKQHELLIILNQMHHHTCQTGNAGACNHPHSD